MMECNLNCKNCLKKLCTHSIPIFASLEYAQLEKIANLTVHRTYEKGGSITAEGEGFDFVAILHGGSAKAHKTTPDGREQILYVFSAGDFFGERNLISGKKADYGITALEPVELCMLYKDDFKKIMVQNPDISIRIIEELGERLSHLENAVQNIGVRSLESRLAAALLELAAKYGRDGAGELTINMPLSREGLANYIGTARETVSRKLGALEDDGIIHSEGARSIVVADRKALEQLAGIYS